MLRFAEFGIGNRCGANGCHSPAIASRRVRVMNRTYPLRVCAIHMPPKPKDLRGLVTNPAWGEGHRHKD